VLAITSGSFAAANHYLITDSSQIKNGAVSIKDLSAAARKALKGNKGGTGVAGSQGTAGTQGAKGDTGATGPQGPKGDNGAAGAPGKDGAKGDTGATGPQGPQGLQGPQGETLVGTAGLPGIDGNDGAPGKDGAPGEDGAPGHDGAPGKDGVDGATGPQGPKGDPGDKGPKGDKGDSELTGAFYATAFYNAGDTNAGAIATVACDPADSNYVAISGGVQVLGLDAGANSRNTPVSSSIPGRMDWSTNAPKPGRLDGWIVQFGGNAGAASDKAPEKIKVWALCVPGASIAENQTFQQV
jgi:hypothetical protein